VLLDVNLNAVKTLDIKGSLAKPTSIIVDEGGVVRYIYAGKSFDDRPSVKTLLAELDALPAAVAQ
jgi:peroxiredoxin